MTLEQVKNNLCYYIVEEKSLINDLEYTSEEIKAKQSLSGFGCSCDNCFYGRHNLASELLRVVGGGSLDI